MIASENQELTETQIIDKAAEAVRERFDINKDKHVNTTKKNLPKQPAVATKRKPVAPEEKEETLHDIIDEMRQSRARPY
jgi:hypothetical protein